jgi:hypothetical protein
MEYSGGDILKIFRSFKPYIIGWVKKYGEIYVGSTNKQRVDYYHKWLCNDLKCGGINQNPGLNKNETNYFYVNLVEDSTTVTSGVTRIEKDKGTFP